MDKTVIKQTYYASFILSAKIIPTANNKSIVITNKDFNQPDSIFPNTPPSKPANTKPWNKVIAVLLKVSNLLSVQNIFFIIAKRLAQFIGSVKGSLPHDGYWKEILNSDASCYGGSNVGNYGGVSAQNIPWQNQRHSSDFTLPPLGFVMFKRSSSAVEDITDSLNLIKGLIKLDELVEKTQGNS